MAIKKYKYNDKTQLTEHFNVQEFKCKCGKNHDILIDDELVKILEIIRTKLGAKSCNIYSGYRCVEHDKKVGGSGSSNRSHGGWAVDCYFLDKNGKRIPSSKVAILLEDLGHKFGIGYRCGKSKDKDGNIHIDTKPRKWYGDESKNNNQSISSFKAPSDGKTGHKHYLDYLYKPTTKYVNASVLNVRNEPNTNAKIVDGIKYSSSINVYYIENEWAKIGVSKWVSAKYLQDTKPEEKNEVQKEEKPENSVINNKDNQVVNNEKNELHDDNSLEQKKSIFNLIDLLIRLIKKMFNEK